MTVLADRKKWELMRDDSKFVNWQKVKVQESSDEVINLCGSTCMYSVALSPHHSWPYLLTPVAPIILHISKCFRGHAQHMHFFE